MAIFTGGLIAGTKAAASGIAAITAANNTVNDALQKAGSDIKDAQRLKEILKGTSLVEASQAARVEPITLVETSLVGDPMTEDLLNVGLNAYIGFYVATASLIANQVNGASVIRLLNRLNANRSVKDAIIYSGESHDIALKLPRSTRDKVQTPAMVKATVESLEANGDKSKSIKREYAKMVQDNLKMFQEKSNLGIGKLVEVNLGPNQQLSVPVFINFRLSCQFVPSNLMEVILTPSRNRDLKERYHAWRAGELEFWNDLVFMRDVVNHKRKQLMADTLGLRREMDKRLSNNQAASLVSRQGSLNNFSSIALISRESARDIELGIGGKLDNFKVRNTFFEDNGIMMLMVMDTARRLVDIYYHSIPEKSEMTESNVKFAAKGTGPDVNAIMQALLSKAAPSY